MRTAVPDVLAGGSVGLLLGALIGFSSSPVVGTIVGAIGAVLAAFLGLQSRAVAADALPASSRLGADLTTALRIASFSIACVIALSVGLWARTHNFLSPSIDTQLKSWTSAGYTQEQARLFTAYQLLGVVPNAATATTAQARRSDSVLFSASADECSRLNPQAFGTASDAVDAFVLAGNQWAELGQAIHDLPAANQLRVLTASWKLICR